MMDVTERPSPNFNDRKAKIDMLVLHYTGMASGHAALERMCDSSSEVSAHYMVWEDGKVVRLVDEAKRAWHAGVSAWQGHTDLNSHSIGIEIVNGGHDVPLPNGDLPPFPDAQMASVVSLATDILSRHAIPQSRIVGHSDIAPARKRDPGEAFPWEMLAEAGIGLWPSAPDHDLLRGVGLSRGDTGDAVTRLQEALQSIGYAIEPTGTYDADTDLVVMAFQRRWAQERLTGDADWMTIAKIVAVAEAVTAETL